MFAARFSRFGGPDVLEIGPAEAPNPGAGEVRVVVRAAGVSPVDAGLRAGGTPMSARLQLPHIPGVDASGVVDELGPGVAGVAVGDQVFGSVDIARLGGATAEFAVLHRWAHKPATMPWPQAGAAGTSVETATRVLDLLDVQTGMTIVVDGAAGGVGSVAIQLAVARGARVIGTARPENHDLILRLGAIPTAYGPGLAQRLAALGVTRVDRGIDIAGAGSLAELVSLTGDPTAVLTIADFAAAAHGVRLSMGELAGDPGGWHGLAAAAELFKQGRLTVPIEATFPLERAAMAHAAVEQSPRRGKLVIVVSEDSVAR